MKNLELRKGLTWRSALAILFGCLIVEPLLIYNVLVSGGGQPYSPWLVLVLWAGFLSFMGKDLTPQEVFIISSFGAAMIMTGFMGLPYPVTGSNLFLYPIQHMLYYANSPITISFGVDIPWWYSPSDLLLAKGVIRSFFHPSWIFPLMVLLLDSLFGILMGISLAIISFQIFVKEQKLAFPVQTAFVGGYMALSSEGKGRPRQVLMLSTFIGFLFGFAAWVIPIFLPWVPMFFGGIYPGQVIDLTYLLEECGLRGASLGFFTDAYAVATGFVTPFPIVILMWIGAFIVYFLGNMLLVKLNIWTDPNEIGSWMPRASATYCSYWSTLRFWMMAIIGISLALAFIPQIKNPQPLLRSLKSLIKITREPEEGMFSIKIFLVLFLGSGIASTILAWVLVPDFPIWIIIALTMGWSFLYTLVSSNVIGVTGGLIMIPWIREGIIVASGYGKWDIWFVPIQINTLGASLCAGMKQALMTKTPINDYIKAFLFTVGLTFIFSFIYVSYFWNMAPIPSINYPATVYVWQVEVQNRNLIMSWFKSGRFFNLNIFLGSFVISAVIYLITDSLGHGYVLPSLLGGITSGLGFMPPIIWTTSMLIGAFLGKYCFSKIFGLYRWEKWKGTIFSGIAAGNSIALILGMGLSCATKAQWVMPY
ncbi:MAG: hypothetical protein QXR45_14995 [Candidatus Bathyarchaeia archaeon]